MRLRRPKRICGHGKREREGTGGEDSRSIRFFAKPECRCIRKERRQEIREPLVSTAAARARPNRTAFAMVGCLFGSRHPSGENQKQDECDEGFGEDPAADAGNKPVEDHSRQETRGKTTPAEQTSAEKRQEARNEDEPADLDRDGDPGTDAEIL